MAARGDTTSAREHDHGTLTRDTQAAARAEILADAYAVLLSCVCVLHQASTDRQTSEKNLAAKMFLLVSEPSLCLPLSK